MGTIGSNIPSLQHQEVIGRNINPRSTLPLSKPPMNLSIVRLDDSITEIESNSSGIDVERLARAVLDYLSCRPALEDPTTPRWNPFASQNLSQHSSLKENLIKSIMRYIKEPDRWTAFSSLLLKSIAFHRHIDPNVTMSIKEKALPVIDLPRTKFNRPYLPQSVADKTSRCVHADEEVKESRDFVMNVSHQFPFICMIQKQIIDNISSPLQYNMIGCDLVIFEARLNKYSRTVSDFLESFVGCYTPSEWQAITKDASLLPRSDDNLLQEFYLRWAMKEAYTKALGLGLNIDLNSFETRLIGHDVDSTDIEEVWKPNNGIWGSIITRMKNNNNGQRQHQFTFVGQVIQTREPIASTIGKGPTPESEFWVYTFIPLVEVGVVENSVQSDNTASSGCVCVCGGPFNNEGDAATSSKQHAIVIENLTLLELIQLHGMNTINS